MVVFSASPDFTSLIVTATDQLGATEAGTLTNQNYSVRLTYKIRDTQVVLFQSVDKYAYEGDGTNITTFTIDSGEITKSHTQKHEETAATNPSLYIYPEFSLGNKRSEDFTTDEASPVVMGGSVRYIVTPVDSSKALDISTYTLSIF